MLDLMDKQCLTVVVLAPPKSHAEAIRYRQGSKIKEFRRFRKLSQADVAERVGVTKAAVSEWERGGATPRQHLQVKLCQALEVPWSSVFGLDGEAA